MVDFTGNYLLKPLQPIFKQYVKEKPDCQEVEEYECNLECFKNRKCSFMEWTCDVQYEYGFHEKESWHDLWCAADFYHNEKNLKFLPWKENPCEESPQGQHSEL